MLFSEVYSAYFNTVAAVITAALEGELSIGRLNKIISKNAFSESMLTVLPALKNGEWAILNANLQTPIKNKPRMPLTVLQKRWLKALLGDPRIALFDVPAITLEDVMPLFAPDDFAFFDRYGDGDPFTDTDYIDHFRTLLTALQEKRSVYIEYRNRNNRLLRNNFIPYKLEYSAKDDKFRLETAGGRNGVHINLGRIEKCELLDQYDVCKLIPPKRRECAVTFLLTDERNALDRVMLHFSDCRKETVRLDGGTYQVQLWYESQDETEILIRILSFGPVLKVITPDSFIALIKNRISMQQALSDKIADS